MTGPRGARQRRRKRGRRTRGRSVRTRVAALLLIAAAAGGLVGQQLVGARAPRSVRASLDYWARRYRVDVHLARAVAWMESGNDPRARSPTGARGVMQVEPETWEYTERLLGHPVDATTDGNIHVGLAYLHHLLVEFHGDQRLALAAYYQGPRAVHLRGVYRSSERYLAAVLALTARL